MNICRVVDPQIIIFGGGMAAAGEPLLDRIRTRMKERSWKILPTNVRLTIANTKQEEAGIIGAALAINQKIKQESARPQERQHSDQKMFNISKVCSAIDYCTYAVFKRD